MASLTRSQLKTSSNNTYDTNGVGGITATEVRTFNDDLIDSLVTNDLTGGMSVLSASFASNAGTVGGQTLTSLNQYTASNDTKWSTLGGITGSFVTETESGSFLVTASVNLNTITFTKGNNSTFAIIVNTGSAATTDITSLNQFTSSANNRLNNLETTSASVNISISNLNAATSSYAISSSVAAVDAAQQSQINSLIAASGSYLTSSTSLQSLNSFTQSQYVSNSYFATTGSNTFGGTQTINGNLLLNNALATPIFDVSEVQITGLNGRLKLDGAGGSTLRLNGTATSGMNDLDITTNTISGTGSVIFQNANNSFIFARFDSADKTTIYNKLDVSGSVSITGSLTASLQQGYAWVGNANGVSVAVATSSFAGGSSTDITALNSFTASQLTINSAIGASTASLNTFTASAQISINNLNTFSASTLTRLTNIETTTASLNSSVTQLNASSASQQISIDAINAVSSSWITESETASFARTNIDNNFTANQTFTNITAVSASFQYVQTLYETASVIYSSGSNQFGDELSDTQTLSGSVKVQGSLTINGTPVLTSSVDISGLTTTASFNAYTQSNNQRVSSLETNSASVNTSITNINTATASLFTSASLALITASFDNGTRNLTFTKGNTTQFSVNIPDASGSAATTIYDTVYTGESITKGDPLYISGSQGANPIVFKADAAIAAKMPVTYVSNETIGAANTTEAIILGHIEGIDLTGYTAGQTIYVAEGGGWSTSLPSGSNSITQLLGVVTKAGNGGKGLVLNPGPAQLPGLDTGKMWVGNGNNQPTEITTASFASSASFNSYTSSTNSRLTNIESTTASLNSSITQLNASSASQQISINAINSVSGSWITESETGSFARTGSNTFTGDQNLISSSIYLNGNGRIQMPNGAYFLGNPGDAFQLNSDSATLTVGSGNFNIHNDGSGALNIKHRNNNEINISGSATYIQNVNFIPFSASLNTRILAVTGSSINTGSFATTGSNSFNGSQLVSNGAIQVANYNETSPQFYGPVVFQGVGTASVAYDQFINAGNFDALHIETNLNAGTIFQDYGGGLNTWLSIPTNTGNNPAPIMQRGLVITGSTQVQNFTASLANGYAWVGNSLGQNTQVATSSFIGNQLTSASFNAYTQSNDAKVNSLIARTGSYATTGSNTFIGDNQLVGIFQAADANIGLQGFAPTVFQGVGTSAVAYDQFVNAGNFDALHIETNLNAGTKFQDYGNSGLETWLQIPTNTGANNPKPIFKRGLEVTGSTNIQELTASLQNGYVWVGNSNNQNTQVATSSFVINTGSFATTGSNTFVGNEIISGSLSVKGNVTFTSVNGITNNIILGNNAAANSIGVAQSVIIGQEAMQFASGSSGNIAIGIGVLKLTSGSSNFGIGSYALTNNTSGDTNLAMGTGAGYYNTTGNRNIFIGFDAGANTITGSSNTFIGAEAGADVTGSNNTIIGRVRGDSSLESTIIIAAGTVQKLRHENNIFQVTGSIKASDGLSALGDFNLASGSNKTTGIVTADGNGTTVTNSLVTVNSMIFLTAQDVDSGGNPTEYLTVTNKTSGSFKIRSSNQATNVKVAYLIINPAV